jgi:DHA1 family inner membrane transport protein
MGAKHAEQHRPMSTIPRREWTPGELSASLAIGTIAVLIIGAQPIFLGAILEAKQVTLEGVGIVAMGEIVAVGLGVVLGDMVLPGARLRLITIVAALLAAAFDLLTQHASGDGALLAVRVAAGLAEGVLVWGATGVIVRCGNPARVAGIFFVLQTIAQAALGLLLAQFVIPRWGWQGAFATLAALSLLPCVLAWLQPAKLAPLAPPAVSGFRWSPATALPLLVIFLQLATLGSFWAYMEPLGLAAGFDAQAAQTLIAGVLAMQVVGGTVGSLAVRRLKVVPALVAASLVLAGATAAVHELAPGSSTPFALACAVFGFSWLFMMPYHVGLAFSADPSGRLAGLVPAAQLLGSAFGPLVASFMVEGENAGPVPLLSAGFALAAAALILLTRHRLHASPFLKGVQ